MNDCKCGRLFKKDSLEFISLLDINQKSIITNGGFRLRNTETIGISTMSRMIQDSS